MFDVITKKLLADYFKISSARPEDWTASSPCHLQLWQHWTCPPFC